MVKNITVTFSNAMLKKVTEIVNECKECSLDYNISIYNIGKAVINEYTPNYKNCIVKSVCITSGGYVTVYMRNGIRLYGTDAPNTDGLFNITEVGISA